MSISSRGVEISSSKLQKSGSLIANSVLAVA